MAVEAIGRRLTTLFEGASDMQAYPSVAIDSSYGNPSLALGHNEPQLATYAYLRDALRWRTAGDWLYRDGVDHYELDNDRFERAIETLGPLEGKTVCDIGSFPGYGMWAFKDCKCYMGLGKGPDWYKEILLNKFQTGLLECDLEDPRSFPMLPSQPDIVICQELLEHIRKPKQFLTALHAWMPKGTRLYLTTNNIQYIGYILKLIAGKEIFHPAVTEDSVYPGHCSYYSLDGLKSFLGDIGFTILSANRINFVPLSRFYRNRVFALAKNALIRLAPQRYATHLEILCQKD